MTILIAVTTVTACDGSGRPEGSTTRSTRDVAPLSAVSSRPMTDGANTVHALRARPLHVPQVGRSDACPVPTPTFTDPGAGRGVVAGPVAAVTGATGPLVYGPAVHGWHRAKVLWLVRAEQPGPVVVRGRRLDAAGAVRFQNEREAALALTGDTTSSVSSAWGDIPSNLSVRRAGCYGLQIDGTDFQAFIVFPLSGSASD